jgi:hypothetical protein
MVFDSIDIISLVEVPDLLQLNLFLLERRKQDLGLVSLLHFLIKFRTILCI